MLRPRTLPRRWYALHFDGTGDYAYVEDAAALTPTPAMSIGGWVRRSADDAAVVVSKGNYPASFAYDFDFSSLGALVTRMTAWHPLAPGDVGTSLARGPILSRPPLDVWCYACMTFDGTVALSGAPESRVGLWVGSNPLWVTLTVPGTYATAVVNDTERLVFNAFNNGGVVTAYAASYFHDWRLWSRQIVEADVLTHMAGGLIGDEVRTWFRQRNKIFNDGAANPPVAVADAAFVAMPAALPRTVKRVQWIGDSITLGQSPDDGAAGDPPGSNLWYGGARRLQWDTALARGVSQRHVSVGGRRTEEGHPNEHDGWSGQQQTSAAIIAACQGSAALTPDARLYSMGTNDIAAGQTLAQMQTAFAARMDDLFTGSTAPVGVWTMAPNAGQSGPDQTKRADFIAWQVATGIPAQVALGRDVQYILVAYVAGDSAGGDADVHPSPQGYARIAAAVDAWLAANGC